MRDLLLRHFDESTRKHRLQINSVAVVGGSLGEPELGFLDSSHISVLGISDGENYFDLNEREQTKAAFSLVICNQVLEHVWNHGKAFDNLAELVEGDGLLWITVPCSTFPHNSPGYFLAGMTQEYIVRNLESRGFSIVESGKVSSRRDYFSRHFFRVWLSHEESSRPLKAAIGMLLGFSRGFSIRKAAALVACSFIWENTVSDFFAVETFCLARKAHP